MRRCLHLKVHVIAEGFHAARTRATGLLTTARSIGTPSTRIHPAVAFCCIARGFELWSAYCTLSSQRVRNEKRIAAQFLDFHVAQIVGITLRNHLSHKVRLGVFIEDQGIYHGFVLRPFGQ